ncbi:ATP-dependent Clp protease adaptor ClpS [Planctomyces sp. SH-PL62]|uniref:ATP-dependent Clp protease adaptor ClpS n=1 Tax=Planctomyces sp. SH-PL62 TaxID=1636152 RepID=UPI00078BA5ED|nr:ATP-dependent Clp protease adaptor ClpS [Planctomyces sp. SH-PL62]AMV40108.1 ATP-dependent Clp protease adapter protein ClpS [Planctomyces sp. SH-PL62]
MSDEQGAANAAAEPEVVVAVAEEQETRTKKLPPFNVIILNDEEHTFEYVIELLIKLFRHPLPTAEALTWAIHNRGRAVVYTTHKEKAELKREQVVSYGADPRMKESRGPLGCYIEPAE